MKSKIISELKRIAVENNGLLQPEIVVEEARPSASPLHARFEWNNKVAGHEYRLWQARQLIRVSVEVLSGLKYSTDVFVSLSTERTKKYGGYRMMADVLTDAQMRQQMLTDALSELHTFREKYIRLKELSGLFSEIRKLRHGRRGWERIVSAVRVEAGQGRKGQARKVASVNGGATHRKTSGR